VPDPLRLLGLDIGGSRSRARLWTDGAVADVQGPSASVTAAGPDRARAALRELFDGLGLDPAHPVDAICAGTAGLTVTGAREFLLEQLAPLARPSAIRIVTDAMLVLPAAGLAAGVAVISGTASVAVGVAVGTDGSQSVQAGGWGYLLGDEGGGYWIVREAFRVLLGRRDRGSPPGELGAALLSAVGAADIADLQGRFYEQPHYPRQWARLAPLVLDAADPGAADPGAADPGAADIAARAAAALADLAAAATRELDERARAPASVTAGDRGAAARRQAAATVRRSDRASPLPVVLAGGLLANAAFADAVRQAVLRALPGADVRILADEPVAGAIRLAALAVRAGG
jgi:glucosamine kinase